MQPIQILYEALNQTLVWLLGFCIRAPQLKNILGSKVDYVMDQNELLRLGFRSFASKLMDHNSIKVFTFDENQSAKNWKTEMG